MHVCELFRFQPSQVAGLNPTWLFVPVIGQDISLSVKELWGLQPILDVLQMRVKKTRAVWCGGNVHGITERFVAFIELTNLMCDTFVLQ